MFGDLKYGAKVIIPARIFEELIGIDAYIAYAAYNQQTNSIELYYLSDKNNLPLLKQTNEPNDKFETCNFNYLKDMTPKTIIRLIDENGKEYIHKNFTNKKEDK